MTCVAYYLVKGFNGQKLVTIRFHGNYVSQWLYISFIVVTLYRRSTLSWALFSVIYYVLQNATCFNEKGCHGYTIFIIITKQYPSMSNAQITKEHFILNRSWNFIDWNIKFCLQFIESYSTIIINTKCRLLRRHFVFFFDLCDNFVEDKFGNIVVIY